jgi:pilus assembly protein Flp/PilA
MQMKMSRTTMHRLLKRFFTPAHLACFARDNSGATAIEYAMIASGISIVIITAVNTLGTTTSGLYQSVVTALK